MADLKDELVSRTLPFAGEDTTASAGTDAGQPQSPPVVEPLPEIPRYQIVRRIGRGGMGIVYEAINPLGVRVALKIIHPSKLGPTLMARFQQEARAMMDLDHPNLVRFYDYGEHSGGPYFTMKLMSGRTLLNLLPEMWRDPRAAVQMLSRIAAAVGFIHSRRKVHRDLKPTNVLLDDGNEPIVSDFGLIKDTSLGDGDAPETLEGPTGSRGYSSTLTHTGARLGTEAYMSPEQAAGATDRIGPPADIWALGVMLHEMIWVQRPRLKRDGTVDFPDWPGAPVDCEPKIVASLQPLIARCLAQDPAQRFASAEELRQELDAVLAASSEAASVAARPMRVRRIVWAAAIALATIGAIGFGWRAIAPRAKVDAIAQQFDPLANLQAELAHNGEVDLIDRDGNWRWHEWLTGEADWTPGLPDGNGGRFVAPAKQIRLLEIARGLPVKGYRLTMQIRHVGPEGEVGVYVGRSEQNSSRGPCNCMVALSVRDFGAGDKPLGRFVLARSCPVGVAKAFFDAPPIDQQFEAGTPGQWRDVTITLNEKELAVKVGDHEYRRQSRNQLLQSARHLGFARPGFEALIPTFQPSEGIGVFSYSGAVEVRKARLTKLD